MKINSQIIVLIAIFLCSNLGAAETQNITNEDDLSTKLNSFLETYANEIAAKGYRSEFSVGNIDPRMNVKRCETPWLFEFTRAPMKQARTTILAQCKDETSTKLYISVSYEIFGPSVISTQLISRGQAITPEHLRISEAQLNTARYGTFQSLDPVIGMIAKRTIKAERPITPSLLAAPRLVNRGDDVMIIASNSNVSIKMPGEALSHGTLGQQISVRNKQSRRVIKARVTSKGLVEVFL